MKVEYKGKLISNISEWEKFIFSGTKKKHWKEGRSAYSIADFIINNNGERFIQKEVSKVIGEDLSLDSAEPEYVVRFDRFGHGREHDLGIFGKTASGKSIFIGVEAKVDEAFGDTIADAYLKAKVKELNGNRTNAPKRIEELLIRNFGIVNKSLFDLRYQLLYSTVGTTNEEADFHILFVLVFKTDLSDTTKIENNKKDYLNFFKKLNAKPLPQSDNFEVEIEGKKLFVVYKMV
jgi:hypothetical protein